MSSAPLFPSLIKKWHHDTYPALSPANRATGKTVIVTGASGGIGRPTAIAFALAGASKIALLGRREHALKETQEAVLKVNPNVQTSIHVTSATDVNQTKRAAAAIGPWHVLVLNAGFKTAESKVENAELASWWETFETNVKGAFVATQAFLPHASDAHGPPAIISVNAALPFTPQFPAYNGCSAYNGSKVALQQFVQHLAKERPDLNVVSVHPGIVPTAMAELSLDDIAGLKKMGILDTLELCSNFFVWVSTPEAGKVLRGKFAYANWDVEEILERRGEIEEGDLLTLQLSGHPFE